MATPKIEKGNVGAKGLPKPKYGKEMFLWREEEDGQRMTLFLTDDEAARLADALDEYLDAIGR